jgi:hypothetical protein
MKGDAAAVVSSRTLIEGIRMELVDHRYLTAVETGDLTRESLKIFVGQQYQIIASNLQSIALLLSRHRNLPSRITDDLLGSFRPGKRKVSGLFSRTTVLEVFAGALPNGAQFLARRTMVWPLAATVLASRFWPP